MIFRQLFQESFNLGLVELDDVERRWLVERIDLDNVSIREYTSLAELQQDSRKEELELLLVSLTGGATTGEESLHSLHQKLPRCALILLDDFDDGTLSQLATQVNCQDVLLKGSLTAATLTRSILFALHRNRSRLEAESLREKAEELAKSKADFAGMVSHEILNPMTGILGYLDILKRTELTAQQKSYVATVRSSCHSLSALVQDLLSFTKLEQGVVSSKFVAFSPYELMLDLERQLRGQNENPEVRVITHCDPRLPSVVFGDRVKLRQVAFNLAQNALKFTSKGQVALLLRKLEETSDGFRVRLAVEDSGMGIPKDKIDSIAQPFCQARAEDSQRGHGLGLAIVTKLLGVMESKLNVQSIEGRGTVFWSDLALRKDSSGSILEKSLSGKRVAILDDNKLARAYIKESVQALGGQILEIFSTQWAQGSVDLLLLDSNHAAYNEILAQSSGQIPNCVVYGCEYEEQLSPGTWRIEGSCPPHRLSELLRASPTKVPETVETSSPYRGTALVVDDDNTCRNYLIHALTQLGFETASAVSGKQALEKAAQQKFDLLALDGHLGDTTGPTLYRRMRSEGIISQETVILIITGDPEGWRNRVRDSDSRVYIAGKPIGTRELSELLDSALPQCPTIDKERLERLSALGEAAVRRLFQSFRDNLPTLFADVEAAISEKNPKAVFQTAHRLKGACSTVGMLEIAHCASALERESGNPKHWTQWQARLRSAVHAVDIDQLLEGGIRSETTGTDIAI